VILRAGNVAPEVLEMLRSKGHGRLVKIKSDPVLVNIVAKENEEVRGGSDTTRNSRGGATVY